MKSNKQKTIVKDYAFKDAHVYPKLEEIQVNVPYAFSLSPRIQKDSVLEQTDNDDKNIFNLLGHYACFKVYPELSTKSVNWHYHGTIQFQTVCAVASFYFYTIRQLKEVCTFNIVEIYDEDWYLYTVKQRHYMYYLCQLNHSPYKVKSSPDPPPQLPTYKLPSFYDPSEIRSSEVKRSEHNVKSSKIERSDNFDF